MRRPGKKFGVRSGNTIRWAGHGQKGTTRNKIVATMTKEVIKHGKMGYCLKCGARLDCGGVEFDPNFMVKGYFRENRARRNPHDFSYDHTV